MIRRREWLSCAKHWRGLYGRYPALAWCDDEMARFAMLKSLKRQVLELPIL